MVGLDNFKPFRLLPLWRALSACAILTVVTLSSSPAYAGPTNSEFDTKFVKVRLADFENSPELVTEIDKIINSLDANTSVTTRIDLDLWKLQVLNDISDTRRTSAFAKQIYRQYERADYASEEQYGDAMQQMVQAFAKTLDFDLTFEIIQNLRESVYNEPSTYLSFIIDKCLMEIYIETFDYERALEVELSILNNRDYAKLDFVRDWKPALHNEVAFLYNRLGNGPKALEYLGYAKAGYVNKTQSSNAYMQAEALNKGNRGRAYLLTGNYDKAAKMGQDVLATGKTLEQNYTTALGYRLSGSAAYHLGQPEKAKGLLEAGIALSDTHNIGTMQKYLYADYALTLESLGEYKNALLWQKKKFALEIEAERSAAVAREELFNAETRARESYKEVMSLRRENEVQREILVKDNRIKRQLALIVMSLSLLAAILTYLFRSLRINQAKLIESENKAQSANKAKSEFLANMSHEIRTPLNGVLGMLQLLQRTNLNEQQKYYTDIMYKSGDSLITVISDILDFSKIEDNKLLLDPVPGDLHSTVKAVTDLFTPKAKEKNLALIFNYDPSLPGYLMYDETRLRQIISNLIGNAIKFTGEGMVAVNVTGTARPNDQEADVIIEVRDTGIGIPEEKISMIFEKFTQAKGAATTSKFGGSGLGLAISLRLAQAMNGTLEAHSEPGRGAIFTVKLPLKIAANPAQNKSKNAFEEERAILTKRLG